MYAREGTGGESGFFLKIFFEDTTTSLSTVFATAFTRQPSGVFFPSPVFVVFRQVLKVIVNLISCQGFLNKQTRDDTKAPRYLDHLMRTYGDATTLIIDNREENSNRYHHYYSCVTILNNQTKVTASEIRILAQQMRRSGSAVAFIHGEGKTNTCHFYL